MMVCASTVLAQEEPTFSISGSADVYYKYDFSGEGNIPTSFADEQNSLSIGMLDILMEGSSGKASFVGEIAFGPRNVGSAGPSPGGYQPRIQNLYVSYAFSDVVSITGGYMGTFVGYEVISPAANFNYSTSYLFTNGPFQNAGVKLDFAVSEQFAFMVGLFNPWNVYQSPASIGLSSFGAQVYVSPVDGWDAYLNFVTGGESGTEIDLTTTYQVSDNTLLGLNAANYSNEVGGGLDDANFWGIAAYLNQSISENAAIGARYEHFFSNETAGILAGTDASVDAFTVSGNIKGGNLTFIPELRLDAASEEIFLDGDGGGTKSAIQFLVAAVYAF